MRLIVLLFIACSFGCVGLVPQPEGVASLGYPNAGLLEGGESLPDRGPGYVRARPGEGTRWGTPELVGAIQRAAAEVARAFPGSEPLRVGDLSSPGGGRHARHGSHRTGRDVDMIFYSLGPDGEGTRGRGWVAYDRHGVGRDRQHGGVYFFDDARNWHLVRTLLLDEDIDVQWIFCSGGVKARLLEYAAAHEPSRQVMARAAWVLHEPSAALRHDDHFHVRVACSPGQRASGCHDFAPIWPWIRKRMEKPPSPAGGPLTDEVLISALLGTERPGVPLASAGPRTP